VPVCLQFKFLKQLTDYHETHITNVMALEVYPNAPHFYFLHSVIKNMVDVRTCEVARALEVLTEKVATFAAVMFLYNGKVTRRQPGETFLITIEALE
jgi:hypothetical protein